VKANAYSQVVFETNIYSVLAEYVGKQLVPRAYPFRVEILSLDKVIASHDRCFEREKDILDPLHCLGLLSQRSGAFVNAIPIHRWRKAWPAVYETMLDILRERWPDGRGIREFIAILKLHREYLAQEVERAIRACLKQGPVAHVDAQAQLQPLAHFGRGPGGEGDQGHSGQRRSSLIEPRRAFDKDKGLSGVQSHLLSKHLAAEIP